MKRFLVLTIILTLVFPAYCFSSSRGLRIDEKSDEILMVEEIMDNIKLIAEDGKVEEEEVRELLLMLEDVEQTIPCEFISMIWFSLALLAPLSGQGSAETMIIGWIAFFIYALFCYDDETRIVN